MEPNQPNAKAVAKGGKRDHLPSEVFRRVEHTLHTRSAAEGTAIAKAEEEIKSNADRVWNVLKKRPSLGVVLSGGIGLALASAVGAGEVFIAVSAAYAAYLVLREHVPPAVAVEETILGSKAGEP
ncbi:MAG: hypothetical protein K0S65_5636 [Labilithrix sp.]|nr:hypothetical protein [Labilithrix sp.]